MTRAGKDAYIFLCFQNLRAISQIKEEITGEFQSIFIDQEEAISKLKEKVLLLEERIEKQETAEGPASKKPHINPDLSVCSKHTCFSF